MSIFGEEMDLWHAAAARAQQYEDDRGFTAFSELAGNYHEDGMGPEQAVAHVEHLVTTMGANAHTTDRWGRRWLAELVTA